MHIIFFYRLFQRNVSIFVNMENKNKHIYLFWKYIQQLKTAYSHENKRNFLRNCIDEEVIPQCSPKLVKTSHHIFLLYAHECLKYSIKELEEEWAIHFHKEYMTVIYLYKHEQNEIRKSSMATRIASIFFKTDLI